MTTPQISLDDLCGELERVAFRLEAIPVPAEDAFTTMAIKQAADQIRLLIALAQPTIAQLNEREPTLLERFDMVNDLLQRRDAQPPRD